MLRDALFESWTYAAQHAVGVMRFTLCFSSRTSHLVLSAAPWTLRGTNTCILHAAPSVKSPTHQLWISCSRRTSGVHGSFVHMMLRNMRSCPSTSQSSGYLAMPQLNTRKKSLNRHDTLSFFCLVPLSLFFSVPFSCRECVGGGAKVIAPFPVSGS